MEKFKVKVTSASEVLEIENILSKIGLVACDYSGFSYPKYIANNIDGEFSDYTMFDSGIDWFKLLTINELKDMVVLMQNNPKDANVYQDGDIPCLYDLYLTENKELYFYHCGKKAWILSNLNHDKDYYELLKPIKEEVMEEPLNDKIATAEVARQEEKHSHYKKDVSHLNVIDVYRVLELYGVESHAVGHAIKKLLCCGQRGAKGRNQDIQEAIDSLNRELEMVTEDEL